MSCSAAVLTTGVNIGSVGGRHTTDCAMLCNSALSQSVSAMIGAPRACISYCFAHEFLG